MPLQVLRPSVGANAPKWDGTSRGHYEVWYLTLSDPDSGRGFWFRYTFEVPRDAGRAPAAELWGFAFTPGRPAIGGKRTVPLAWPPSAIVSERRQANQGHSMNVDGAVLEEGRARGELPEVGLVWDVRWEPSSTALWHIPAWVGRSKLPSTRVCSPSVDAVFTGEVRVGGEVVTLTGGRGCQTHLWGRQHAARWAWGHCNAFHDGDGRLRDDVLLEAIWARPLLAPGRPSPAGFTFLYAEVGGEVIPCNAFPWLLRASSRVTGRRWELRGRTRDAAVRAVLEGDPSEMAQVTYQDPDGTPAWCVNTEIARCALEVERPDGSVERFTSEGLAHVEFGDRRPDPGVPVLC